MNNSDHSQQFRCGQVFLQARTDSTMPDVAEDLLCFFPNKYLGRLVLFTASQRGGVKTFDRAMLPLFVQAPLLCMVPYLTEWGIRSDPSA